MPSGPPPSRWPVWDPAHDGYAALARYVTTAALPGLGLTIDDTDVGHGVNARARRLALLGELWERLLLARYRYNCEPWTPARGQRVRDPRMIHRSAGTCLDIAVMFAAMCKDAGLRPYLVVLRDEAQGGSDHAMVLVDLGAHANDADSLAPPVSCEVSDEEHVYVRASESPCWEEDGSAVAIDVVRALVAIGHPEGEAFAEASAAGEHLLLDPRRYGEALLVDVVALHAESYRELPAQDEAARPTIYPKLPSMPAFVEYESRLELRAWLAGKRGLVVLHGESGVGKSTLAAMVAREEIGRAHV